MKQWFFFVLIHLQGYLEAQPLQPFVRMVPMRDGKFLVADCYVPDTSGLQKYPVILIQTPYNRLFYRYIGLPLGIGTNIAASPYAFVIVDWRGFYGSSAAAVPYPDRGKDGYDVIEWIVQQPWSNGKVGTWGASALGKVQFWTAREKHPSHICAVPLVASPLFTYQEFFHGGVYRTEYIQQLDNLGFNLSSILLQHPYYDMFWQFSEFISSYPGEIEIPVFMIGGWYDHTIEMMLHFFELLQQNGHPSVKDKHKLLIGPWVHGGSGEAFVGSVQQGELTFPEAAGWSDSLSMRFFDYYLRGIQNNWETEPAVRYFLPGNNMWFEAISWQSVHLPYLRLYLQPDGSLGPEIPATQASHFVFVYDPRDPSPTIGGMTLRPDLLQGPYDQSIHVESRSDVLVFTTPVLSQPVTMLGKAKTGLYVSSDRKDTDFTVRLTDVFPDNRSILLREGIIRMRMRNGFRVTDTVFMQPGQVYFIEIPLFDIAHTFMPGHRIRLVVSSSNYPRFDRNLNNGAEMYVAGDTLTATNTVWCSSLYASYIDLPIVQYPATVHSIHSPNLNIYPNPVRDLLVIETDISSHSLHVYISTMLGQEIFHERIQSEKTIMNLSILPDGIYFINISDGNRTLYTGKFVKSSF